MATFSKRSVAPVYAVACVWLLWGLFLPLHRLLHFLPVIALSVAAFWVGRAVFPDRTLVVPDPPPKPVKTGNPALDELIAERDRAVSEMRRLNDSIEDETLSAQIDQLEQTTKKIIAHVVAHPDQLPQIRQFMNYYLPTTLKLLNAYDRMGAAGISGENIGGTMEKVESIMQTIVTAFQKQLDALFGEEALDISTDITVMEQLLAREGLADSRLRPESQ